MGNIANKTSSDIITFANYHLSDTKYHYLTTTGGDNTKDTVNDIRFQNISGKPKFEVCTVANAVKGSGTWRKISDEYQLYFGTTNSECELFFENAFTIETIVLGHAVAVQYSVNNGVDWTTYSTSVSLSAGAVRFRVSNFGAYIDGTIILKTYE